MLVEAEGQRGHCLNWCFAVLVLSGSIHREQLLALAPSIENSYVRVPKIATGADAASSKKSMGVHANQIRHMHSAGGCLQGHVCDMGTWQNRAPAHSRQLLTAPCHTIPCYLVHRRACSSSSHCSSDCNYSRRSCSSCSINTDLQPKQDRWCKCSGACIWCASMPLCNAMVQHF